MSYTNNMAGLRDKGKLRQIFFSRVLLVIFFAVLAFGLNAAFGAYLKYGETKEARDEAQAEVEKLQEREKAIQKEITRLETSRGVEEEIRNQYGFAKKGEGVIVIVEPREGAFPKASSEMGGILGNVWGSIKSIFSRD